MQCQLDGLYLCQTYFFFIKVDGEWGEWGNWSSCSLTCGNGTMTRMRYCNSPSPDNGGSFCIGNNTEYENCMDEECLGTFII